MKLIATTLLGIAGLIYGLLAINLAFSDAPESLRWFIVLEVTGVGAAAGWLIGFTLCLFRGKSPRAKSREA